MKYDFDYYLENGCVPVGSDFENKLLFNADVVDKLLDDIKWYKMWHEKFKKEIEELKLELTDYRPTKLKGNGHCKCDICGLVCWTDWFYMYKRKLVCDNCLKKMQGEVKS